ncbi:Cof-type HAD-IIB family hydrolase [Paenibacillus sonchi]|uniref:Cof-type HAD-IIB family hydrolase n=1 Tax=Paenibacillus sonchi TaxID=373687 RepID=UPI001E564094|nr:Cof-type HAD-IIB family hydrolase [Paenibacillus sonchi]MCE3201168.1 Cof-type HAD-IIB family hydrolase [Paenibacillus sonchi]
MNIKLIAVDMDGTFLDDKKNYHQKWFEQLYAVMKAKGVHFVVASGNQYYKLKTIFEGIQDELAYVAENGAYVIDGTEVLFTGEITPEQVKLIVEKLSQYEEISAVMCGVNGAYVLESASKEFYELMCHYYPRLEKVSAFEQVNDQIFKFSLITPDLAAGGVNKYLPLLMEELKGVVDPVTSGHQCIDLIIPGCHKASGLERLLKRYGVRPDECAAFGDSSNDIEMLKLCKYSYAMENASPEVKAVVNYHTVSNNQHGVLHEISLLLGEPSLLANIEEGKLYAGKQN